MIPGATGAPGQQGQKGDPGATGAKGDKGAAGVVTLYNSTVPQGRYSQAFNGPQITQFGNAVNLASNPAGAALDTATVTMTNFGPTAFSTPVTFTIYNIAQGGVVGSVLATDTETVAVPAGSPHTTFTATFHFSGVVLPDTIVYGITLNELATDCSATPADCGNNPNPIGSLNVNLSANASSGSNVYPGYVYVSSLQADTTGTALASNLGACPDAPTGVLSTFQGVPVSCNNGYGSNFENVAPHPDFLGTDTIPAVKLITVG